MLELLAIVVIVKIVNMAMVNLKTEFFVEKCTKIAIATCIFDRSSKQYGKIRPSFHYCLYTVCAGLLGQMQAGHK